MNENQTTETMPANGSTVTTTVYSIGGRSEKVTGRVVDQRRRTVIVETECHGRLVVPLDKIELSR